MLEARSLRLEGDSESIWNPPQISQIVDNYTSVYTSGKKMKTR